MAAGLGVSAMLGLGGVLNLFHLAKQGILHGLVAVGAIGFIGLGILKRFESQRHANPIDEAEAIGSGSPADLTQAPAHSGIDRVAWCVCWALVLFVYLGNLRVATSQSCDDATGYFALAKVMQQTGTINQQSFSERRMLALGGDTLLRAVAETDGSFESAHLIDPGVALIMLCGIVAAVAARVGTRGFLAAMLPAYLTCVPLPAVNSTSILMLVALMVVLTEFIVQTLESERAGPSLWARVGLVAAAIISLKSSIFPLVALLCAGAVILALVRSGRGSLMSIAVAAVTALAVLLPWMIGSWQACGTLMFPILGNGDHHGMYSQFSRATAHLSVLRKSFDAYLRWTVVLLLIWGVVAGWRKGLNAIVPALLASAAVISALLLDLRLDGFMIYRFQFPLLMAAIIAMNLLLGSRLWSGRTSAILTTLLVAGLVMTLVLVQFAAPGVSLRMNWTNLASLTAHPQAIAGPVAEGDQYDFTVDPTALAEQYRSAQAVIPAGESTLLVASHAFLWDFTRNPARIGDNVGTASPTPGMPLDDAQAMATYLKHSGIRYLFVTETYGTYVANFLVHPASVQPLDRDYLGRVVQFQKAVHQLAARDAIYDDRGFLVLDLHGAEQRQPGGH